MKLLRRLVGIITLAFAAATGVYAQNFTTVTASNIGDASGTALANGTICFQATDIQDAPVAFSIGGVRQANLVPVCGAVSNGVITGEIVHGTTTVNPLLIANPANTIPAGIVYRITVTDTDAGTTVIAYKDAVISGSSFNFDQYVANPNAYTVAGLSWNAAATVNLGTVSTVPYGTPSAVTNSGNSTQAVFNFTLEQGPQGPVGPQGPAGSGSTDNTKLLLTGGTLTGPTDTILYDPTRTSLGAFDIVGSFNAYMWTGTIPGTSAFNYGQQNHFAQNNTFLDNTPGCWGYQGTCYSTEHGWSNNTMYVHGGGGTNFQTVNANFYSTGDHIGYENYITSFGGSVDGGGPEGTKGQSLFVSEANDTWSGTVASAGTGQTTLSANCVTDCGSTGYVIQGGTPASLGQGMIVTDEPSTPPASGQIMSVTNASGEIPGTISVNITSGLTNLAVSTCEATLNTSLSPTTNPSGSGSQTLSFAVTDVAGTCTAGGLMNFSGTNHEQASITSVTAPSGGQQTITANVRMNHEAGSYIIENANSDAGFYADLVVNDTGTLKFPVEILGVQSISGNTAVMWWRRWYAGNTPSNVGGFPYGHMVVGASRLGPITNSGGTVSATIYQNFSIGGNFVWQAINGQSAVYFSIADNSIFNGPCTNVKVSFPNNANPGTLTCTQAASTGQSTTGATLSFTDSTLDNPYGNSRVNFYHGAAIVDPQDYSAPATVQGVTNYPVDGKQFTVEPNEMSLNSGDTLIEHHSEPQFHNFEGSVSEVNPQSYTSDGYHLTFSGIYANGGSILNNVPFRITNGSAYSNYQYFGGTMAPTPFIVQEGNFASSLYLYNPPAPFNYVINSTNCPSSPGGCNDTSYWYGLYAFAGNGGWNQAQYYPATNTMQWGGVQQFNNLITWNGDTGASRTAAHTIAFGNGTQGDTSATVKAGTYFSNGNQLNPGRLDARLCSGLATQTSSDVTSQVASCLATANAANLSLYVPYEYTVNYVRIPNGTEVFCDSKYHAGFLQDPTGTGNPGGGDTNYATVAIQTDSSNAGIGIHDCIVDGNKANIYATGSNPGNTTPISGIVIEHANATGGHPHDSISGSVIQNTTGSGVYIGPHDYDSSYNHNSIYGSDQYGLEVYGVSDIAFEDFNIGQSGWDGVYVLNPSNVRLTNFKTWFSGQGLSQTYTAVAASSGGNAVYSGTFTNCATQNCVGRTVTVSGFTNSTNNGTFTVTAYSSGSLTLNNASAVAETHAASGFALDPSGYAPGNYFVYNASTTAGVGGITLANLQGQDALGAGFYLHGNSSQNLANLNGTALQSDSANYALQTGGNGSCFDLAHLANSVIQGTCGKEEQATPGIPTHAVNVFQSTGNIVRVVSNSLSVSPFTGDSNTVASNAIDVGRIPLFTGTYASTYTPNPQLNAVESVTLTGNVTIGPTASSQTFAGMTMGLFLIQDATGSRTVSWNADYTNTSACTLNTSANEITFIQFEAISSTQWVMTGCGNPTSGSGGGGAIVASAEIVTFSATPTFSTSYNASRIVMTGNITSFTLGAGTDGQDKKLCFEQGSGAPYTVTPPSNVHGFFTVGSTASTWSCQSFNYDATDALWLANGPGVVNE